MLQVMAGEDGCGCRTPVPAFAADGDVAAAARIQRALLPPPTLRRGEWMAAHRYSPAGTVGGDLVDLFPSGDRLYFMLADVSGKGIAAALLTTYVHAVFRALIPFGLPIDEIVRRASALLCASTLTSQYVTLVFGYAGPQGEIEVADAGHPPPLILGAKGVERLVPTGAAAGMFCQSEFGTTRVTLAEGESLLIYSDGLTEAFNRDGVEYGPERVEHVAWRGREASPAGVIAQLTEDLEGFLGGQAPGDDLTILTLQRQNGDT